jgi:hypothetical protein
LEEKVHLGDKSMEKSTILKWMQEKCGVDASGERGAWMSGSHETTSIP